MKITATVTFGFSNAAAAPVSVEKKIKAKPVLSTSAYCFGMCCVTQHCWLSCTSCCDVSGIDHLDLTKAGENLQS